MTSGYIDRAARVARMTAALRRHITAPGSLECGQKRQAAYIIEDIDPADCIDLDQEAFRIEGVRRSIFAPCTVCGATGIGADQCGTR